MHFPISDASPIEHGGALPDAADVVVIGGGIIGLMTAWFLARKGQKVVLCEKGRIAGEQSSRNWGWIRKQGRDPAELPIVIEAEQHWQAFSERIGPALGFRRTGVLYLANDERSAAGHADWLRHAETHDLDTRLLTKAELAAMLPNEANWRSALWTASDSRAEPVVAVPLLARMAQADGVILRENCAVRGLDIAAGAVAGVVTEAGMVRTARVVLAGGAWSSLFLRAHGLAVPQLTVLSTVAATVPLPEFWTGAATDANFAIRRRADGGYTLAAGGFHDFYIGPDAFRHLRAFLPQIRSGLGGTYFHLAAPKGFPDAWSTPRRWDVGEPTPFEQMRVLNPAPNMRSVRAAQAAFARAFPKIGYPEIALAWGGMIDAMPDVVPVVDHAPLPGLTVATGMSGHGFGIGPGIGRVVADLVMGNPPGHDLRRFRFGRFTDGSKLELGPAL